MSANLNKHNITKCKYKEQRLCRDSLLQLKIKLDQDYKNDKEDYKTIVQVEEECVRKFDKQKRKQLFIRNQINNTYETNLTIGRRSLVLPCQV